MQPRRDEITQRTVVLAPGRPYPVMLVRCAQVANESSRLRAEAMIEGGGTRAAALVQLADGLLRVLDVLAGRAQQQQEGVNPMAKKNNGKVQCMCKVCGTMYAGTAEDSRCEPLAELCARCEALVRGEKPSAGAAKRACGNKAPKELIAELRDEWAKVQAEAVADSRPVQARSVPVVPAASEEAPEAKCAKKKAQRGAGGARQAKGGRTPKVPLEAFTVVLCDGKYRTTEDGGPIHYWWEGQKRGRRCDGWKVEGGELVLGTVHDHRGGVPQVVREELEAWAKKQAKRASKAG